MKKKILIEIANYYKDISKGLYNSALDEIKRFNKKVIFSSSSRDLKIYFKKIEVSGVFEIPVSIARNINKYDAFIALGCVVKGQTPHFNFIAQSSTDAIMKLSVDKRKPIGNGIITCLNKKQANMRKKKGKEAASAVISVLVS